MTRRSYRGKYKNQHVPREVLQKILEAGLAAPSGCNKQATSGQEVAIIEYKQAIYA